MRRERIIFVPALALALYATIGHPDLPDLPLSARLKASPARMDLAARSQRSKRIWRKIHKTAGVMRFSRRFICDWAATTTP